jgi:hypothetical protein
VFRQLGPELLGLLSFVTQDRDATICGFLGLACCGNCALPFIDQRAQLARNLLAAMAASQYRQVSTQAVNQVQAE